MSHISLMKSYDLSIMITTKSSRQVLFHIKYMSQDSKVIFSTIPIVFLKQIIVYSFQLFFLFKLLSLESCDISAIPNGPGFGVRRLRGMNPLDGKAQNNQHTYNIANRNTNLQ